MSIENAKRIRDNLTNHPESWRSDGFRLIHHKTGYAIWACNGILFYCRDDSFHDYPLIEKLIMHRAIRKTFKRLKAELKNEASEFKG